MMAPLIGIFSNFVLKVKEKITLIKFQGHTRVYFSCESSSNGIQRVFGNLDQNIYDLSRIVSPHFGNSVSYHILHAL